MANTEDGLQRVVVNHEEQYSIWPADREPPEGWTAEGFQGDRESCVAYIDQVWTDMRPLSLRRAMEEAARGGGPDVEPPAAPAGPPLPDRLAGAEHRVDVVLRPEPSAERLRAAVERGYLHLRFPDTDGGTEVGVALHPRDAALAEESGRITLSGEFTLDFTPLHCTALIDTAAYSGSARVERR
ncbi:MbtH family protein [Allonocardiopsis opalescens]|uniref:Uncharacterized protein YbdZ (MbtH family) n=1 Tax=Allonocardiopsis opalescens TaxID=1144618 RepID=A0A2T0PYC7_9ACTN|nr:uncharacterized protein YbdZ (MbtH family) [Allonocardiopsis opalescens]